MNEEIKVSNKDNTLIYSVIKECKPSLIGCTYSANDYNIWKTTNDSDTFENVIDNLIMNKMKQETRNKILGYDKSDRRLAILSLLDHKDKKSYLKLKDLIGNGSYSRMDYIKETIKELKIFVKFAKTLRQEFAEVMTPIELVTDILNKLPKEVWSNPNLKWLDACNGVGTFLCLVIAGLMKGLKDVKGYEDEDTRYKHIIENMIYAGEIQPINAFFYQCIVDTKDFYKINTFCGDFLNEKFDYHKKEVWKVDHFDIIVGNPPYNKGKIGSGNSLWDKFVVKYLGMLKPNGYLAMVHPTAWRKPQSGKSDFKEINSLMMSKQILYLEMHNTTDGLKIFNAGTRYDIYVLENCDIYKKTIINDEDRIISEIYLQYFHFIPNKKIEFIDKILIKENDDQCHIMYSSYNYEHRRDWVSNTLDEVYQYPLIHTTPKKGTRYMYSSINNKGHFGISKVIFGDSGIYDVIIDMDGDYGMSSHAMAIQVSSLKEAENIKKALMSDNFRIFLESVLWSNFQIDWILFSHIKKDFWKEFI